MAVGQPAFGSLPSSSNRPVITVLGATGTGKTKLSVHLCRQFNGEVISTDSMQIYQALDIVTNKATPEEMQDIPHHMLSFLSPKITGYSVTHFRDKALQIMEDIWSRNKVPVLVGGTTYYTEAILWNTLIDVPAKNRSDQPYEPEIPASLTQMSNEELYAELRRVDPAWAEQVHHNNRARMMRAIQIFYDSGRTKSDILAEMRRNTGSDLGGSLRFDKTIVFYLDAEPDVLKERLDKRVDQMVQLGLRQELCDFVVNYPPPAGLDNIDRAMGIHQSIGLKEFAPFLQLSPEQRDSPEGERLFQDGCELLKLHTRQYAKKQRTWVKSRLLKRVKRQLPPVYLLDSTDPRAFDTTVMELACKIVDDFLNDRPIDHPQATVSEDHPEAITDENYSTNANQLLRCEICNLTLQGRVQWDEHVAGKNHKYQRGLLARKKRLESGQTEQALPAENAILKS
uniref:tRNA dimethylallyltransferase n=1 Tax=Plectus sambesii TaxID=2011161 RepID=A0A914W5H7_9BILA